MVSALISVGGMSSLQGSGDRRRTQGGLHGKIPAVKMLWSADTLRLVTKKK